MAASAVVRASGLGYRLDSGREILTRIDFHLPPASFLAIVGENGAGKTSLLDLLLGFRRRTDGELSVLDRDPETDPWQTRARIAYLSEKIDIPGDWEPGDFLEFHRRFYDSYDRDEERALMGRLRVPYDARIGTMSAGEIRRVQIIGALATWAPPHRCRRDHRHPRHPRETELSQPAPGAATGPWRDDCARDQYPGRARLLRRPRAPDQPRSATGVRPAALVPRWSRQPRGRGGRPPGRP